MSAVRHPFQPPPWYFDVLHAPPDPLPPGILMYFEGPHKAVLGQARGSVPRWRRQKAILSMGAFLGSNVILEVGVILGVSILDVGLLFWAWACYSGCGCAEMLF